jgi:hypothetical protein
MRYSFNFIQIANWLSICRDKLKKVREATDKNSMTAEEAIASLEAQKKNLLLIKDIIERKTKLLGIQKNFLEKYKNIKKEFGIEDK